MRCLRRPTKTQGRDFLRRLVYRSLRAPAPVAGLYLWGGVGRGKTFLTELLFETLPIARKRRLHFHRFMAEVHARLHALHEQRDPLRIVAHDLAADARLLVLDECVVSDIGDAMLLGHLLELLFTRGVTLVATSNIAPVDLYKDGLQRAQFLPAIAAIERNCAVLKLDGAARLPAAPPAAPGRDLVRNSGRCSPAEERLRASFERLAPWAWPRLAGETLPHQRSADRREGARRRHRLVRFRRAVRRPARCRRLHRDRPRFPHRAGFQCAGVRSRERGRRQALRPAGRRVLRSPREPARLGRRRAGRGCIVDAATPPNSPAPKAA